MSFRFTDRIAGVACSDVHDELCELIRVTRSFSHERSMTQFIGHFETETLPPNRTTIRLNLVYRMRKLLLCRWIQSTTPSRNGRLLPHTYAYAISVRNNAIVFSDGQRDLPFSRLLKNRSLPSEVTSAAKAATGFAVLTVRLEAAPFQTNQTLSNRLNQSKPRAKSAFFSKPVRDH
jgi:hypothetical protein